MLKNHWGKFKSAYSQGMNLLNKILFEEDKESDSYDYLNMIEIDIEDIQKKYKTGDTIFGAFKPNFNNKEEFSEYWKNTTQELAFTSYFDHKCLLDYIWFQGNHIKITRVLDVPSFYDDLFIFEGAPNEVIPSDHFPIMAEFYIS